MLLMLLLLNNRTQTIFNPQLSPFCLHFFICFDNSSSNLSQFPEPFKIGKSMKLMRFEGESVGIPSQFSFKRHPTLTSTMEGSSSSGRRKMEDDEGQDEGEEENHLDFNSPSSFPTLKRSIYETCHEVNLYSSDSLYLLISKGRRRRQRRRRRSNSEGGGNSDHRKKKTRNVFKIHEEEEEHHHQVSE